MPPAAGGISPINYSQRRDGRGGVYDVLMSKGMESRSFSTSTGTVPFSLDREFARTRSLPVRGLYLLLVGLILVLALLTIPPFLAGRFCKNLYSTMLAASLLVLLFCLGGLLLSWNTDISSRASIITIATLAYFLSHLPRLKRVR